MTDETVELPDSGVLDEPEVQEAPPQRKGRLVEAPTLLDGKKAGDDIFIAEDDAPEEKAGLDVEALLTKVNGNLPPSDRIELTGDNTGDMARLLEHMASARNVGFQRYRIATEALQQTQEELRQLKETFGEGSEMAEMLKQYREFNAKKRDAEWRQSLPDPTADPEAYVRAIAAREAEALRERQEQEYQQQPQEDPEYPQRVVEWAKQSHEWSRQNDPEYPTAYNAMVGFLQNQAKQAGVPDEAVEQVVFQAVAQFAHQAAVQDVPLNDHVKGWYHNMRASYTSAASIFGQQQQPQQAQPKPLPQPSRTSNHGARPGAPVRSPTPTNRKASVTGTDDFFEWASKRASGEISDADVAARLTS